MILKEREDETSQLNRLRFYRAGRSELRHCAFKAPDHCCLVLARLRAHALSKFYGQAERAISTRKLQALLPFHSEPIKQVVFLCPSYPLRVGRSHLEECFTLICIQRLSQPNFATQPCHVHDSWNTRGSSIPVLSY